MMMRTGKPTIIVIAALVMFSFGLGVGPARGLDLTDILGNILGGGGSGGGSGGGGGGGLTWSRSSA